MARKKNTKTPSNEENAIFQLKQQASNTQPAPIENSSPEFELVAQQTASDCGGALKAARERAGLSIENLAARLRLSVHQIHALETDNFSQLPQPPAVRGFIRNYAKEVRADAAPILAAYLALNPNQSKTALSVDPAPDIANQSLGAFKIRFGMLAGAGLLALVAWFSLPKLNTFFGSTPAETNIDLSQINKTENSSSAESNPLPAQTPITKPQETDNVTPPAQAENAIQAANQATNTVSPIETPRLDTELNTTAATTNTADANLPMSQAPAAAPASIPAATTPAPTATAAVADKTPAIEQAKPALVAPSTSGITISAKEASWVEITNSRGATIFSKVIEAGAQESISVSKPFNITAGNAGGVAISYNGEAVTLNSRGGSKVGRISLK